MSFVMVPISFNVECLYRKHLSSVHLPRCCNVTAYSCIIYVHLSPQVIYVQIYKSCGRSIGVKYISIWVVRRYAGLQQSIIDRHICAMLFNTFLQPVAFLIVKFYSAIIDYILACLQLPHLRDTYFRLIG